MRTKIFFAVVIMAFITLMSYGQNAKKHYKVGVEFVESKKYDDAVVQFTNAISLEPASTDYYYARGQVYYTLKKYAEAKADYEKILVLDQKNVDAMISLGIVCNNTDQYEEALRLFNKASKLEKRNAKIYTEKTISLIGLARYDQALQASDTALIIKDTPMDYYWRGVAYFKLNNVPKARIELEKAIKEDEDLAIAKLKLAEVLIVSDTKEAMLQCNKVIDKDDRNTDAYLLRSRVYKQSLDYPNAINDISRNIIIDPANPDFYYTRATYYQEFNQHANAIGDYSKYIQMKDNNPEAYFARAKSYEEIMNFDKAMEDYSRITVLSEDDPKARRMLKDAQARLYELNREKVAPEISVISPIAVNDTVEIRGDKSTILITGKIREKSKMKSFLINSDSVTVNMKSGNYEFFSNIDITGKDSITLIAIDDYDNKKSLVFPIKRTEIDPPLITIKDPYTTPEGIIMLSAVSPNVAIQGIITDASKIKSITVGNKTAQYDLNELNPAFTAILEISNITKFPVVVEDIYGNKQTTEYIINREGADIAANNPMGRTWVVFIENSSYETFASLDGPIKDVSTIRRALANYQIHFIIHKKDMTKAEMDKFFNIELRDQVKQNQVKSLLVWYAGHGKNINEIGYWIPVDAKRDDEFTYFNINAFKAGMQGYGDGLTHTLVVSDACESGPGFFSAMRSQNTDPTCDDAMVASLKSAQVFTSAGYELAMDNSKFTATFANTLEGNRNACIPIQTIVKQVTEAVKTDNGQKPQFGIIQGLNDMYGTFFFIAK